MFGYSEAVMVGKNISELMPERFRSAHHHGLMKLSLSETEFKMTQKPLSLFGLKSNNQEFPILLTIAKNVDYLGEIVYIGTIKDETKIKEQQYKLEKSQQEEVVIGKLLENSLKIKELDYFLDRSIQLIVETL